MASVVETLRDKWEAITPRERKLVVFGGSAALLVLVLWLAMSIRGGLTRIEHRNARMENALDVLGRLRQRGSSQKPAQDVTATIGTEPVRLETYLSKAAEAVQIPVPPFTPRTAPEKNGYKVTMVSTELHDLTIDQLKSYLEQIETGNKLVVVTSMSLNRNFRDKEKIDVKLEVSTYSKPKDEGAGSGAGSGSGSASGAGPASGGP